MKYGLLGGTFDPPHRGHLETARAVRESLELDEVIFIPANRNPLKDRRTSSIKDRLRMVELMIEGEQGLSVSDIETSRGGSSFTIETVEELKMVQNGDYWFVMGADSLKSILDWKEPEKLISLCRLAVVQREGSELDEIIRGLPRDFSYAIDVVPMQVMAVSSSKIREDVLRDVSVEHMLKPAVWEYIKNSGLYKR